MAEQAGGTGQELQLRGGDDAARALTKTTSGKFAVTYDGVDDQLAVADQGLVSGNQLSAFMGQKTGAVSTGRSAYNGVTGQVVNIQNQANQTVFVQALGLTLSSTELTSITAANVLGLLSGVVVRQFGASPFA